MRIRSLASVWLTAALLLLVAGCDRGDGPSLSSETDEPGYRQGQQLAKQGRTQEALSSYLKVIAKRGDAAPESHLETGLIYLQSIKDPLAAIYHFRKYLELQPNSRQAVYVKGLVDTAKREFARTLPAQPLENQAERLDNLDQIDRLQRENEQLKAELSSLRSGGALPTITTRATLGSPDAGENHPPPFVAPQVGAEESPIKLDSEPPKIVATLPLAQASPQSSGGEHAVRAKPTPPSGTRTHTVQRGDTLFNLAQRYYGSSSKWRAIYDANRDQLPSQNSLRIRMVLKIP